MPIDVKCVVCGQPAIWYGCVGCDGESFGTVVCKNCGSTVPGVNMPHDKGKSE